MNDSNNPRLKLAPEMVRAVEAALAAYPKGTLLRIGIRDRRNKREYSTLYFELGRPFPLPIPEHGNEVRDHLIGSGHWRVHG